MQPVDGLPRRIRTGDQHLRIDAALAAAGHGFRPQLGDVEARRLLAGGVDPILDEDQLQAAHHVAPQPHVQVAIRIRADALIFLIGDVDAAGEGLQAIDDDELAVRAQVQPGPLERFEQLSRVEPDDFGACIQQRLQEALADGRRADRIEQQAHAHAGGRTLGQRIAQRGAGVVRIEDVVLKVQVVLGRGHRGKQCAVGGRAIDQPLHLGGRAR